MQSVIARQHRASSGPRALACAMLCLGLLVSAGCWAPLHYHGIPANTLPDTFRTPCRTGGSPLVLASLTQPAQLDYILGPSDILEVTVQGLYPGAETRPVRVQVMANGDVHLPLVGPVHVGGMNLVQAQSAITKTYADGFIRDSRVNVFLVEKSTISVVVLGEVNAPGVYRLPKYENDVAHALAMAGGLSEDAAMAIEVHRRLPAQMAVRAPLLAQLRAAEPGSRVEMLPEPPMGPVIHEHGPEAMRIVKIPLQGPAPEPFSPEDVVLQPGDVVVVPNRRHEVFYVVGKLTSTNVVRFSLGIKDRELGNGLLLPSNREIDVVTAVAMAGYIDPIDSPTTVTVHRTLPDGKPLLIVVDLIRARYDRRETILVQAGDIIYLNPDFAWWGRRTIDRFINNINVGLRFSHPF